MQLSLKAWFRAVSIACRINSVSASSWSWFSSSLVKWSKLASITVSYVTANLKFFYVNASLKYFAKKMVSCCFVSMCANNSFSDTLPMLAASHTWYLTNSLPEFRFSWFSILMIVSCNGQKQAWLPETIDWFSIVDL